MSFEAAEAAMDVALDAVLGDAVEYRQAGNWVSVKAYVEFAVDDPDYSTQREETAQPRLRIHKRYVSGRPSKADRVRCVSRLGEGLWTPMASTPDADGSYWLVDLQRSAS